MQQSLTGNQPKVALITGAARNMGRAFALGLAEDGVDILVHYHSDSSKIQALETAEKVQNLGRRALTYQADLTDSAQVNGLFSAIHQEFGRLDIVVNNAGTVIKKPFVDYTEADFDKAFNTNSKAVFLVMQQAARYLQDQGRVINMGTSLLAAFTGHYGLYAGSKAPLEDFSRALAKEIGHRGITVNTVAPGPIDTAFFHGEEDEQSTAYLKAASVQGRLGKVGDIVPVIRFLASPQAAWVTGQTLFVNGGFVTR